jgi:flagellar M-ring protein FliF
VAQGADRFREIWRGLEPRGQLTLIGGALAVVVTLYLVFSFASKPSWSTVDANLNPTDSAAISKALDSAGIPYQLKDGGTAIAVHAGDESRYRVALASKGLPRGEHVGFELFDKKSLGMTDFQQKVDYQRALEGEVDRTIQSIQGISSADVQLVIPDDSLFSQDGPKASAAVLLTTSQQLDPSAVAGIAHLVSGAVKGLSTDAVTITDDTGAMLWPPAGGSGLVASTKLQIQQQYSATLAAQLDALLTQTLGPGKAQARVNAVLNVDQTTLDKVTYGKSTPLATQTDKETLSNKNAAGSVPASGTASNIPAYAGSTAATNGKSSYLHQVGHTDFGVDRTEQHTTVAPGEVQQLSVALLVDKSVPKAELASLQKAVAAAAGIDPKRGDTLQVASVAFNAQPAAAATAAAKSGPLANPIGLARDALIGLGALLFLFFARRGLKKREGESLAEPTWLREIEGAMPVTALEGGQAQLPAPRQKTIDPGQLRREQVAQDVEEIVHNQPEHIAVQVGQWLKE